jgi:hypothetical protein
VTGVRAETVQSVPVRFVAAVCLTKREAFDACQALADADRFLLRAGQQEEARALGDLFELLEERLSARRPPGRTQASSGSKASDSEFTQYR